MSKNIFGRATSVMPAKRVKTHQVEDQDKKGEM
jgi:hypothetical protein